MIDKNSQFMAILTNVGAAKLANANALGLPWKITALAVGDANGTDPVPSATQTKLINELRRAPLNQLVPDPKNAAVIVAEQVIPENVGGFWIREIGLYDQDGDLVAVANCPATFKPLLAQGSGRTQIIRMNLIVSSTANIELKIDPSVVLATREYVDLAIDKALPGDKKAGTYTKVQIDKRGVVIAGENPTTLAGYGIVDAYKKTEVDFLLSSKANNAITLAGYGIGDAYTKTAVDGLLAGKATKATTLGGYGITNGVALGDGGWLAGAPAIPGSITGVPGSQLFSGAGGVTTDGPPNYPNTVGLHMIFANPTFGADIAVSINEAVGNLLFRNLGGTAPSGWRTVWHDGNFTPSSKISGNYCPAAGFAAGDKAVPYMMHTDGTVVRLATDGTSFGVGQTRQAFAVGTERVAGTTYYNTTPRPIWIYVEASTSNTLGGIGTLKVGNSTMKLPWSWYSNPTSGAGGLSAVVLPGESYVASAATLWVEVR